MIDRRSPPSVDEAIIATLRTRWIDFTRLLHSWTPGSERAVALHDALTTALARSEKRVTEVLKS